MFRRLRDWLSRRAEVAAATALPAPVAGWNFETTDLIAFALEGGENYPEWLIECDPLRANAGHPARADQPVVVLETEEFWVVVARQAGDWQTSTRRPEPVLSLGHNVGFRATEKPVVIVTAYSTIYRPADPDAEPFEWPRP